MVVLLKCINELAQHVVFSSPVQTHIWVVFGIEGI